MAKRFVSRAAKRLRRSDGECCPFCGGTGGVLTNDRAVGWISRYMEWNGEPIDTNMDKLRETIPQSGRCSDCNRIVANPQAALPTPSHTETNP